MHSLSLTPPSAQLILTSKQHQNGKRSHPYCRCRHNRPYSRPSPEKGPPQFQLVPYNPTNPHRQRNIPFKIYERDPSLASRSQGWAITLHWALQYLPALLPPETLNAIEDGQVDPEVARNDTGNFLFLDLSTGDVKWRIPPNKRWRVNREKLRRALSLGIEEHVEWGVRVEDVHITNKLGAEGEGEGEARLIYSRRNPDTTAPEERSGTERSPPGKLIIGTEGARSTIRRFLCPMTYKNTRLPVRFTGVIASFTAEEIAPLRAMDPLLFQGCHPETGVFLWFSMLDTPTEDEVSSGSGRYKVQLGISWHVKSPNDEVPSSNADRLANMKRRAEGFVPFLYDTIQRIPEGTEVVEVTLADWECPVWENREGMVTLAGDAAHAMTMCMSLSFFGLMGLFSVDANWYRSRGGVQPWYSRCSASC